MLWIYLTNVTNMTLLRMLKANPLCPTALRGVTTIGFAEGKLPELEAILKRTLTVSPFDEGFRCSLAACYLLQGRYRDAAAEVAKVQAFCPDDPTAAALAEQIGRLASEEEL